jgi:hypothetical protein
MEQAKQYAARFYSLVQQEEFDQAANLFASNLPHEEALKVLHSLKDLRGGIIDAVTDKVGTTVTTRNGKLSHVECNLELNCIYQEGKTRETLTLQGESFESLHIAGYHFDLK